MKKTYGLDLGTSSVKIAEITRENNLNRFWMKNFAREIDGTITQESIISALKEILHENSLKNEKFVLSIPRYQCILRKLTFPFKDLNKISKTINFEIEPHIPYPITEIIFDFFISKITETGSEVIILVINKNIYEYYKKIILSCNIKIQAITTADIAEYNYIALKKNDIMNETNVIINFGAKNVSLTVIKDGIWDFSRSIQKGGDFLADLLSASNNIPFIEAEKIKMTIHDSHNINLEEVFHKGLIEIFNDIRRTLNSYLAESNLKKINKIYITGGGACIQNICDKLSSYLEIESQILFFDKDENSDDKLRLYFSGAALGCAIQQKKYLNLINLNLSPKEQAVSFKNKLQIYITGILLVLCLGVFSVRYYLMLKIKNEKLLALNNEIHKIFTDSLPEVKNIINPKLQLQNAIKEEKNKMEMYSDMSYDNISQLEILKELNTIIDKNINIEVGTLLITKTSVVIGGKTVSFREIDFIKDNLKKSKYFKNITVDSLKTRNDGKVEFKIAIKI